MRATLPRMTIEEFFDWAEGQPIKYELVDGVPVPLYLDADEAGQLHGMASGSDGHHDLILTVGAAIRARAPEGCRVRAGGAAVTTSDTSIREPDLLLACGPRREGLRGTRDPVLIVEILSPTTANIDRGEKLIEYQALPSVREVWLVDSTRRAVTVHTRLADGWLSRTTIADASLTSEVLGAAIPLDELYAEVDL